MGLKLADENFDLFFFFFGGIFNEVRRIETAKWEKMHSLSLS